MSTPAITPQPDPGRDAASPLIDLLPRWIVVVVGLLSLAMAILVLVWAILQPQRFGEPFTRTVFAVLIAFALAIGLFILYPLYIRIKAIPYTSIPVEVVGPVALFIVVLFLIRAILPLPQAWQFHRILNSEGQTLVNEQFARLKVAVVGTYNPFYLVPGANLEEPVGIMFFYNTDQKDIKAMVKVGTHKSEEVTFHRDETVPIKLKMDNQL